MLNNCDNGELITFPYDLDEVRDMNKFVWRCGYISQEKKYQTETYESNYSVTNLSYHYSSRILACGGEAYSVDIVNRTEKDFAPMNLQSGAEKINSIAFSHDGLLVAGGGSDNCLYIWSTSGCFLLSLSGHTKSIWSVSWSSKGYIVSGSLDGNVCIWDPSCGKALLTVAGKSPVRSVCYSPDGCKIAWASEDCITRVWEGGCEEDVRCFEEHSSCGECVVFHPDNVRLSTSAMDGTIRILDSKLLTCLIQLTGHNNSVLSLSFSPCGFFLASASNDMSIRIWDTNSGECVENLEGHNGPAVTSVVFTGPNELISTSSDKTMKIWTLINL